MVRQLITLIILLQISLLSCKKKDDKAMSIDNIEIFQKDIEYPYSAPEKKKDGYP